MTHACGGASDDAHRQRDESGTRGSFCSTIAASISLKIVSYPSTTQRGTSS